MNRIASTSAGGNLPIWLIGILAVLLLGGGGGFLLLSGRARALAGVAGTAPGSAPTSADLSSGGAASRGDSDGS